ncbi:hypothetical protein [Arthrobacter sp. zg-Y1171]|uniref:hypothetical protein n=1 Tax=Arthrobacter sp. zg-Y1171 TaxID=2964610 RepID=UPI0021024F17|nr:hypothetical protein [Arthrobacter sp. zg-Y1171]MCQ1994286.1 hypothetical protein [Arthrobacter sp. zg-Y1171]UWX81619.1 hypothetical protein N2L00_14700 [Arthrobacter sp. zg-Y1171]
MNGGASKLEATYTRALGAYPRRWRREQGEELIGVLLYVARSEHRTKATPAELLNLVGNGLATRGLELLGSVGRRRRNGIAFTATVLATYLALTLTLLGEWGPWVRPGTLRWRPTGEGFGEAFLAAGPFTTAAAAVYLALLAGFVAALAGRHSLRRTLHLSAAVAAPLIPLSGAVAGILAPPLTPMLVLSGLALLALIGNPAASASRHVLLGAVTAGVSLAGLWLAVSRLSGGAALFFYDAASVLAVDARSLTLAAAALMLAVGMVLVSGSRTIPWTAGLAVASAPLLVRLWSGDSLETWLAASGLPGPVTAHWEWAFLGLALATAALAAADQKLRFRRLRTA